jgi:FKBP-type peptidyl-prolyl cis-trans isomerases 1
MKKLHLTKASVLGATVAALLVTAGCNKESQTSASPAQVKLDSTEQKVTYIVGYNMAKQAQANGLNFEKDVMSAAIQDVLDGKEPRIAQSDQQQIMMAFQEEQQNKREGERKVAADANLKEAQEFLAENAKKEGVTVTESGLQYEVLQAAPEGAASPSEDDVVKVHYHGTLVDGSVFDSSIERGQPVSFPVKGVINGWVEALQLMKVGDKFKLYIPPELAYGEGGTSGKIGPNAALIFEVELLEINPEIEGH